jgi:hypothetical protein
MKSRIIKLTMAGAAAMALIQACAKKDTSTLPVQTGFGNKTLIRVFVATVNASRNYVYVDGQLLNGAPLASGGIFPASGVYASAVDPGVKAFMVRDTLTATTQLPLSFAQNMQMGKNYTIFTYDTITSPKQKTVETNYVVPTDTSCRIRFANFIYNATDVPAIDVFSLTRNSNVFTNVPVTGVTDFIPYPSNVGGDTLYIRETGTATPIIKVAISSSTLQRKRSYTLVYRGSHRGTRIATLFTDY